METLLIRCTFIFRRLFGKTRVYKLEEIKQLFDDIILYLDKLSSDKRKTDGIHMLTVLSDELTSVNIIRLFDHSILRNHQIFLYIKQTFEMLFIKCSHYPKIIMSKQEETCLDSISYLVVQLCLSQNEPVELFYGKVPKKIYKVTKKPNTRDPTFDLSSRTTSELMDKPNLKAARLPPRAPPSRPIEHRKSDITTIVGVKKFIRNFVAMIDEIIFAYPIPQPQRDNLPQRKYQDFFLTQSFFDTLLRTIEDLSQNEYSPFHIKYKIVDRFVRLCSQLKTIDILLNPIIKCLRSKNYRHALESVEINQIRLSPKQLFFLHECTQFIIQHNFLQNEQVVNSLCERFISLTKTVFNKHFLTTDFEINSNQDGDRRIPMHVIGSHLEFLYHLSIIPSTKKPFLESSIITQLLLILNQNELIQSVNNKKYLFNSDVAIVAYSLLILCNLAYEKEVLLNLKNTNLHEICDNLKSARDYTIQFTLKTLSTILNADDISENHEPRKLREAYIKYIDSIMNKPKIYTRTDQFEDIKEIGFVTKYTFLTDSFIEKLFQDIKRMSTEEYASNLSKYKETIRRIHTCAKQDSTKVEILLNPVIACLKSEFYMNCYENIDVKQNPNRKWSYHDRDARQLAFKHMFYMYACPEFICQQDYRRQKEVATSLCELMLQNAQTIFSQHLSVLFNNDERMKTARIDAMSFHIKLLSHLALAPSVRKNFLSTSIIDHIILILENEDIRNGSNSVIKKYNGIVRESLTLFYNLAFDNDLKNEFKKRNLLSICEKFFLENDEIIRFTSQTIRFMLNSAMINTIYDTQALCRIYINIMDKSSKEPRRPYQGIKLRGFMQNLEILITNDKFQENIVKEKNGISALVKCLFIKCIDDPSSKSFEKIRRFALNILWNILRSIYGLDACIQLKSNDQFVEYVLYVVNQTAKKPKEIAGHIIWKLGDERIFRSEQNEKERKRAAHGDDDDDDNAADIDEQLITNKQLNDFHVFISVSNHVADKIICRKIAGRLKAKQFHVYVEKSGAHRSEMMRKAAQKKKTIIFCLSNEFQNSKDCMTEIEHASKYKCPFVSILTDSNYKPKGWLNHLIGEKNAIDFGQKNIKDAVEKLIDEINKLNEAD